MSKCFRKGLKYVFTAKNFKKDMGYNGIASKECNGHIVEVDSRVGGVCCGYHVIPEWCKCIGREAEN